MSSAGKFAAMLQSAAWDFWAANRRCLQVAKASRRDDKILKSVIEVLQRFTFGCLFFCVIDFSHRSENCSILMLPLCFDDEIFLAVSCCWHSILILSILSCSPKRALESSCCCCLLKHNSDSALLADIQLKVTRRETEEIAEMLLWSRMAHSGEKRDENVGIGRHSSQQRDI